MNDLNETNRTNGGSKSTNLDLPPEREAVVEQGNRIYQTVAHERDTLQRRLNDALADIAGYKVALEAHASQQAMRDSHMASLQAERDQAVARRANLESALASVLAILRTHQIEHEPMVKTREWNDEEARQEAQATARTLDQALGRPRPVSTGL